MKQLLTLSLLLLALLVGQSLHAQAVKVTLATQQRWAGGVCCAQGIHYRIQLHVSDKLRNFQLDSLWIGETFVPMPEEAVQVISKDSTGSNYLIQVGQSWGRNGWQDDERIMTPAKLPKAPAYEGDAILLYRSSGVRHRVVVGKLEELMMIAYP